MMSREHHLCALIPSIFRHPDDRQDSASAHHSKQGQCIDAHAWIHSSLNRVFLRPDDNSQSHSSVQVSAGLHFLGTTCTGAISRGG